MDRNQFGRFATKLLQSGATAVGCADMVIGEEGPYQLQYIPFEYVNTKARLVIVGITPGSNQLELAYNTAQASLRAGNNHTETQVEIKKAGAFGGRSMKPNLLKMLRHFRFERLLGITDVETLWSENAEMLHSTSVVPHATFKARKMFAGSFEDVMASSLLRECFLDCFVASIRDINPNALYVGLGPCPEAALAWCVEEGVLKREQVLGAFCHPSTSGGSATRYYLREVRREQLSAKDPVLHRTAWLDAAFAKMQANTHAKLSGLGERPAEASIPPSHIQCVKPAESVVTRSAELAEQGAAREYPAHGAIDWTALITPIGYRLSKDNDKVLEFIAPGGAILYLLKKTSRLNRIQLVVNPQLQAGVLRGLPGVEAVGDGVTFHSNMTRFPKRINNGKTPTAFGRQVTLSSQPDLIRFLVAFSGQAAA